MHAKNFLVNVRKKLNLLDCPDSFWRKYLRYWKNFPDFAKTFRTAMLPCWQVFLTLTTQTHTHTQTVPVIRYKHHRKIIILFTFITNVWNQLDGGLLTSCRYQILELFIGQEGGRVSSFMPGTTWKTNKQNFQNISCMAKLTKCLTRSLRTQK